jgi:alanine-synthesizing transaminase
MARCCSLARDRNPISWTDAMTSHDPSSIPVATRVAGFTYAIRNIVAEAREVEATGVRIRYLNIGDPCIFGFEPPRHLVDTIEKAMRDNCNFYSPSPGIPSAREAVAADFTARGVPTAADRVLITTGTSEGIDLTLNALANPGDEVLVPMPTYPLYTAVLAKISAKAVFYRLDPARGWAPDLDEVRRLVTPRTRALVVIDPNNPTGSVYPTEVRRALLALADQHGFVLLADEVYGDLAYDGPVPPIAALYPDAPIISFSSLSKAFLAPGWRAGWMAVGRSARLDDVMAALRKLADGRLCSPVPMQYAVTAALTMDRSHEVQLRADLRARAEVTTRRFNAMPGMSCVAPVAAFYAMPRVALPPGRTDEDFVLGLLRATGVLCVHGSGFGMPPDGGYFRVVFLASPAELDEIYSLVAGFTERFVSA